MQWTYCKIHDNYLTILVLLLEDVSQPHAAFWYNFNASLCEGRITPLNQTDKTKKKDLLYMHVFFTERHDITLTM